MALVTIQGIFKDPNGTIPTSGTITFQLSGQFVSTDGVIRLVKAEAANLQAIDGSFSIQLESTLDGVPANRSYSVQVTALVEGVTVTQDVGSFQLAPTPSTQQLKDLILGTLSGEQGIVTHVDAETPSGTINGINTTFTLAKTPVAGTLMLFYFASGSGGGVLWRSGIEYTLSGATITPAFAPNSGDALLAFYRRV